MHAYLFLNYQTDSINQTIEKIVGKNRIVEFEIQKTKDVPILRDFLKLNYQEKIVIWINNFDGANTETQNAMLKILEEPQENVYFAINAKTEETILPTILSRCEILRHAQEELKLSENQVNECKEFWEMNKASKMVYIKNIRKREEAISFLEGLIKIGRKRMIGQKISGEKMEKILTTLKNIQANGNSQIQLTGMVLGL